LVTDIFGSYIQILLKQYESNPAVNWKAKDVAVFLLTALTVSTFRVATGANSVNTMVPLLPFFGQNVMPDLRNPKPAHPILQADALKFVITFRSQIPATEYGVLIPALVGLLKSPVVVVHTYAANALDHMLTIKDKSETGFTHRITKESLEPMLRDLLGALFGVFQANGQKPNSYVMRAIMRVLSKAKEKIAPLVSVVLDALSNLLRTVILNPQSPVFNHYLFESIGAMIGCASAAGGATAVTSLQAALLPMFQTILGQDLAEFTGYVFQLLCQLLGEHQEVPEVYWGLFPSLLAPLLWSRPGNVPALVRLLGQYLSKGAAKIATNDQWMVAFLGVWQHLNSVVKHDGATFELLVSFTDFMPLPVSDKYLPRVLQLVFVRLSNPKMKTPRYINGFVTWLLSFAARHGGSAIVQRCNSVQQGIWVNCLGLIAQSMNKPRSPADKKRCALGAVRLLTATDEMLADGCVGSWPQVLSALMALFELPEVLLLLCLV
jgi:exportin-2 (importin alpha re-exporter)